MELLGNYFSASVFVTSGNGVWNLRKDNLVGYPNIGNNMK